VTDAFPSDFWDPDETIPAAEAGGLLTIDLGALAANWRLLRDRAGGAECAAVVKADAYGIGIEPAVSALWNAGCRTFFVAHLSEAVRARETAPDAIVYVLNGFLPGTGGTYVGLNLRPVLGSMEEVREWAGFCAMGGIAHPAALHVDTGINRLGLSMTEALDLATHPAALKACGGPALLMTHFVSSEEPDNPLNARQIAAFGEVRAAFAGVPASACNSAGIFLPGGPHLDLVRPGYALYGGNPQPGQPNPMRPVVRLEAKIIQVREIAAGETVGYNAQWTAPGPRRIATLSIGYADGYPRRAGGTNAKAQAGEPSGMALVGDVPCPFAGRVSMDLITIDVTAASPGAVARGRTTVLIGDSLDIDEVGRRAGTIGYEILTSLGGRYARRYLNGT
jgi:alanine racemase